MKSISVLSGKKQVGKTTICRNISQVISKYSTKKVLVIELNEDYSDLEKYCGLENAGQLVSLFPYIGASNLTKDLIFQTATKVSNFYILNAKHIHKDIPLSKKESEYFYSVLKEHFDLVIFDVSKHQFNNNELIKNLVFSSDMILSVITQNTHLVKDTTDYVDKVNLKTDNISYIINNYNSNVDIDKSFIEKKFKLNVIGTIPYCAHCINSCNYGNIRISSKEYMDSLLGLCKKLDKQFLNFDINFPKVEVKMPWKQRVIQAIKS